MNLLQNKTVLIIGLGLIGGSIARGLANGKHCKRILAHGKDDIALQSALIDGSIHACSTELSLLAPQADLIIICTPTLSVRGVLEQLKDLVGPDTIITDVASVKSTIVADARMFFPGSLHRFVPGHPIAGSEQSGYVSSKADLFAKRKVILTPLRENSALAVQTVMNMWQKLGADVHGMSAERHDVVLAGTSHLPHLLAFTLVNTLVDTVSQPDRAQQVFDYAAGGFADFSRIASSDPEMWRDIFMANKNATIDVLDAYVAELNKMRHKLMIGDSQGLQNDFSKAKFIRDEFIKRFRPESIKHINNNMLDTSFSEKYEAISVYPGSFLFGHYRPAADSTTTIEQITRDALSQGIVEFYGVPESVSVLTALQLLRQNNIPVLGPESGYVRIYNNAPENNENSERQDQPETIRSISLPADQFLCGLFVLGAASLRDSHIKLSGIAKAPTLPAEESSDKWILLEILAKFGFVAKWQPMPSSELFELEINSYSARSTSLNLKNLLIDENELLIVFAAAASSAGVSIISLKSDRIKALLDRLGDVATWAADICVEGDSVHIVPKELHNGSIQCSADPYVTLIALVIGQRTKAPLSLRQTGDLAGIFPGLLAELARLGFGFALLKTHSEEDL